MTVGGLTIVIVPVDRSTECQPVEATKVRACRGFSLRSRCSVANRFQLKESPFIPLAGGAGLGAYWITCPPRRSGTSLRIFASLATGLKVILRQRCARHQAIRLSGARKYIAGKQARSSPAGSGWFWLGYLAQVFEMPLDLLTSQAKLARMDRRSFMALSALTVAHGKLAAEMVASIAQNDYGPLTQMQTTHGTDLVIASFTDHTACRKLHKWMNDGESPILRVNAAGILAKTPGQDSAKKVATVLAHDLETQQLYMTAVIARVGALPWSTASKLATGKTKPTLKQANFLASRLAAEVLNPRDAGARWCSATMLRELSPLVGANGA